MQHASHQCFEIMVVLLMLAISQPIKDTSVSLCAGVKLGKFSVGAELCDPDNQQRQPQPEDIEPLQAALQRHMPHAVGELLQFSTCMFTMTPDKHFVIETHPKHQQVGKGTHIHTTVGWDSHCQSST